MPTVRSELAAVAPNASEQGAGRVSEGSVEQHIQTAEEVVAADLTVVKGLGPAVQERLQ